MNVAWNYLNKYSAAITALQDYSSMRYLLNTTPQEIKDVYDKLYSPRSARPAGTPSTHDPKSGEDSLIHSLGAIDVLQERYMQTVEYLRWFEPAWSIMTNTEKEILKEFYLGSNRRSGANQRLQKKLGYSERQIGRLRAKALSRLVLLLFGK